MSKLMMTRDNKPLRTGMTVTRLAPMWNYLPQRADPIVGAQYVIEDIKIKGTITYVRLVDHHGWWHAHDFESCE